MEKSLLYRNNGPLEHHSCTLCEGDKRYRIAKSSISEIFRAGFLAVKMVIKEMFVRFCDMAREIVAVVIWLNEIGEYKS